MAAADMSCSVRTEGGKRDGVLETVTRICSRLDGGGETAAVVESLRELQRVHMTVEVLEATKIGRTVNALRKNAPSEQARQLAAALYTGWKAVVDERLRSSSTPPPPPKAGKGIEKGSSSPPVHVKMTLPEGDREMAPTRIVVEAAPETKLHLHDEFDSATIVKKPSILRVRVINTNAPGTKAPEQPQHRVTVVRRTATRTPEPAPASNARKQNGGGPNSKPQASCAMMASQQGTNAAAKRVSPPGAAPLTTAKPSTALPKPIGSLGACKRKAEDATVFDEARLARATARLHERYNEIEAAKEKRKIKEIKGIDAQRMEKKARQRPVQHLRCTPAHRRSRTGTGKHTPVACPPRMPRAF